MAGRIPKVDGRFIQTDWCGDTAYRTTITTAELVDEFDTYYDYEAGATYIFVDNDWRAYTP